MKFLTLVAMTLFVVSCANKKDQKVIAEKVSQETVTDGRALGQDVHEMIRSSKTLTEKQKIELEKLMTQTKTTNKALVEESFKIRSVLIKELLSGNANQKQVKLLKKNIKKNESLRLKSTFSAIDKMAIIVSKDPERQMFMEHILYMDRPIR